MSMPLIPDTFTGRNERNHVPIIMQLSILTVFLSGVFGVLYLGIGSPTLPPAPVEPLVTIPLDNTTVAQYPQKLDDVSITASAAYVWDVRGQRALFKKNEATALPIASITKLMTALLAHELVAEQDTVAVSLDAIRQEGNSGINAGEAFRVRELSELALLSSSNDAAYSLGATVGALLGENDPTLQFITGMNIRARELGFSSLEFKNTTGLDLSTTEAGAVGSARDVTFLMEYILTNYPVVLTPTQQEATRIYSDTGEYHDAYNTNVIADRIPNLLGSKTGYTDLAGGNLTIAFDVGNDRPIIITVLGSTRDERFTDVLTLVEAVEQSIIDEL